MILAAEFPAIPSSAVKIASERRCAALVHSGRIDSQENTGRTHWDLQIWGHSVLVLSRLLTSIGPLLTPREMRSHLDMAGQVLFLPLLLVVDKCLRFWLSQSDWKWLKMIESEWKRWKMTESDGKWLKLIDINWKSMRRWGKTLELSFWDFARKVGQNNTSVSAAGSAILPTPQGSPLRMEPCKSPNRVRQECAPESQRAWDLLCPQSPRAKFLRNFSKRSAKNAAKFWRKFSQIFVLQFPGKMAAKNFTKNPRHFPRCTKLSFFHCCNSGGLKEPEIWLSKSFWTLFRLRGAPFRGSSWGSRGSTPPEALSGLFFEPPQIFQKCCQTIFLVLWPSKHLSYKIVW